MSTKRVPWLAIIWVLPALAGAAQGAALAGGIRWWALLAALIPSWLLQSTPKDYGERIGSWRELAAVTIGGYVPALLACGLQSGVWLDRRTLILATPIAMWLAAAVLVDGVRRARAVRAGGGSNLASRLGDAGAR